jgi:acetyl esterase/lipase
LPNQPLERKARRAPHLRRALAASCFALLQGCSSYELRRDLSYRERTVSGSSVEIGAGSFDLYESPSDVEKGHRPAVLAIHGGAWSSGSKSDMRRFAEELCPWGYVVLAIDYRLAPQATWPAQLEDCRTAYRYFRAHAAELGLDPDRIAALGVSAGAHLATMLELRDDPDDPRRSGRPALAVDIDGEHDMFLGDRSQTQFTEIMTKVVGHGPPWSDAELRDLSTLPFARSDCAVLIIHGANDPNVFVANADELFQALREKHADVEYVRLEGDAGNCHSNCWTDPRALDALHRFLDKRLK